LLKFSRKIQKNKMKFGKFTTFSFLVIYFYFVIGIQVKKEESDCDKYLPYLHDKVENCCKIPGVVCDNEGFLIEMGL